jgi:hypothetical protein
VELNFPFVFTILQEQVLLSAQESLPNEHTASRELPSICVLILH